MYFYVITEENDKFIEQNGRFALKMCTKRYKNM